MALITWSEKYSVKLDSIDRQHKKLVDLINKLHEAMRNGNSKDVLGGVIKELVDYTIVHFTSEEKVLEKYKYTGILTQKFEHEKFVKRIQGFSTEFQSGRASVSLEIITFLKDWLINHIMKNDMAYSDFLIKNGVK